MVEESGKVRRGIWSNRLKKRRRQVMQEILTQKVDLQARHYRAIMDITRAVSELTDLHTTLRRALSILQTVIPIDAFWVGLYDFGTDTVSYPLMYDSGQYYSEKPIKIVYNQVTRQVLEERKPVVMNRTAEEIETLDSKLTMLGDKSRISASIMFAPLILGKKVIGIFSTHSYQLNSYTQDMADFLRDAGHPIATALNNARYHEEQQRRLNQLDSLYRMGQAVSGLQDLSGTLHKIFVELTELLPLDTFYVLIHDYQSELLHYLMMYDDGEFYEQAPQAISQTIFGSQILAGQDILINRTVEEISKREGESSGKVGNPDRTTASIMAVGVNIGDNLRGVISAQSYTLNAYNTESLSLLKNASLQIGVALHNARLYEKLQQELKERHSAEAAVRQLNAELEIRVEQRTAELAATNKDLESFTYSISHDLRAPLRAMNSYATVLGEDYDGVLDEEGQRILGRIIFNTKRMGQLVDDLLSFSRMGRKEIHLRELDLNPLLQDVLASLEADMPSDNTLINAGTLPACVGDEALVRQVLVNLIENAIKYSSKEAQPEVKIYAETDNTHVWIHVEDNGIGFDMAYLDKLFVVFQRLHSDESYSGTGVGLAVVYRIVTRLGGDVRAQGIPGEGATFSFSLPRHASD